MPDTSFKAEDSNVPSTASVLITGLPDKLEANDHMSILQLCMGCGPVKGLDCQEESNRMVVKFADNETANICYKKLCDEPIVLKDGSKLAAVLSEEDMNTSFDKGENNEKSTTNDVSNNNTKDQQDTASSVNNKRSQSASKKAAQNGKDANESESEDAKRPKNEVGDDELDYGAEDNKEDIDWNKSNKTNTSSSSPVKENADKQEASPSKSSTRRKPFGENDKSKVLHLRNLPETYNKNDFCKLVFSFGKITHCIFMKSQCFVEMDRLDDAVNMVEYCSKYPLYYMDQKIITQYSEHQKLRKNESHSRNNKMIETTIDFLWNDISPHERTFLGLSVIMATVENMIHPVDMEALHQIFSKYGKVLKIRMIVSPSGPFKALIQMENPYVARLAIQNTDNQNIYSDANLLRTKFYRIKDLIVQPGDKNAHDFTKMSLRARPSLSNSHSMSDRSFNQSSALSDRHGPNSSSILQLSANDHSHHDDRQLVALVSNLSEFGDDLEVKINCIFTLFSTVGVVNKVKIMYKTQDRAFVEFATQEQANNAVSLLNGTIVDSKKISVTMARVKNLVFKPTDNEKYHEDFTRSKLHRFSGPNCRHLANVFPPSVKLHLANLHVSTKEEDIVPLFKKYGQVDFFAFMEKKHMAYLKMNDVADAVSALINLHGKVINGLTLKVSFAKQ